MMPNTLQAYWDIRLSLLYVQTLIGAWIFSLPLRPKPFRRVRELLCLTGGAFAIYGVYRILHLMGFWSYRILVCAVYGLTVFSVWECCETTLLTAVLVSADGFLAQHMAGSFKSALRLWPSIEHAAYTLARMLMLDVLCYATVYGILVLLFHPKSLRYDVLNDRTKGTLSLLILLLCIGMSGLVKGANGNMIPFLPDNLYALFTGFALLFLQVGMFRQILLTQNVDTMKTVVSEQQRQYKARWESTELVNEKYHDLKQMFNMLQEQPQARADGLTQMDRQISEYDLLIRTGNELLDIMLTEKRQRCEERGIQMSCMLNGAELAFMEDMDLYALFSNALTNAIEAAAQTELPEERFLSLNVKRENDMVLIHMENSCVGEILFCDGIPQSRQDRNYHGFGMKSMNRIVRKYGGELITSQKGRRFLLDIILFANYDHSVEGDH